jgi:hypothetical protein
MVVPVVAQRHHDLEAETPCLRDGVVQSPKDILSKDAYRLQASTCSGPADLGHRPKGCHQQRYHTQGLTYVLQCILTSNCLCSSPLKLQGEDHRRR